MMILSHYLTSFPRCFCVPPNKQMFFIILLDRLVANYWELSRNSATCSECVFLTAVEINSRATCCFQKKMLLFFPFVFSIYSESSES